MKIGNFGMAALVAGLVASAGHVTAYPYENLEMKLGQSQAQNNNQFKNQAFLDLRAKVKELEQKYQREDPDATDISYRVGLEVRGKVVEYLNRLGIPADLMAEPSIFSFDESIVIDNAFCPDMSCTRGVDKTKIHNTNYIRLDEKGVVVEHFYDVYEKGRLPFRFDRYKIGQQNGQLHIVIDQAMSDELQLWYLDDFNFWATHDRVAELSRMLRKTNDKHVGTYIWYELNHIAEYFMHKCGIDFVGKQIGTYQNRIRIYSGHTTGYGTEQHWFDVKAILVLTPDSKVTKSRTKEDTNLFIDREQDRATLIQNRKWETTPKLDLAVCKGDDARK